MHFPMRLKLFVVFILHISYCSLCRFLYFLPFRMYKIFLKTESRWCFILYVYIFEEMGWDKKRKKKVSAFMYKGKNRDLYHKEWNVFTFKILSYFWLFFVRETLYRHQVQYFLVWKYGIWIVEILGVYLGWEKFLRTRIYAKHKQICVHKYKFAAFVKLLCIFEMLIWNFIKIGTNLFCKTISKESIVNVVYWSRY